nr:hypothetical protein LVJ77_10940 [Conchiformibius kuhniae]
MIIFIARPNWIMWYLYSLMLWYALTPLLQKCRFSLALSCAAALAAGWATWDTYWFSLGRTLCFLPFFLLGQQHGTALLHRLRHTCPAWQHLACIALITALLAYCCVAGALNISFVYGSFNFWQQHLDPIHGTLLRVFVMLLSALGVLAALQSAVLLSGRRGASILAALGRRTLPVYLLHGFAVLAVQPFYPWRHDFAATCLFATLASVLTAWACSRNGVQKVFDGIIFGKQTN